jgi:thioredoxin reductase (NADPH)
MQDRVLNHPKVTVHWHTETVDVYGENNLMTGIKLRNIQTGVESEINANGLFYAIGHQPNTNLFANQIELDDVGYIKVTLGTVATSVAGVYAAGDVQDHEYRQAVSAAGTGCMAALAAERWLAEHNLIVEYSQQPQVVQPEEKPTSTEKQATTEADFDLNASSYIGGYALRKLFHESDRLIMVKYVSPTCGPCGILSPILNKVVEEYAGKIHFVEIDIVADPEIAQMGQVSGTPTVQFFRDQELLQQVKGVQQKSQYRQLIEQYLPTTV